MAKRENCEHRHTNGNCLFNGGFCLANDEEHCVRINEIKSYNQAIEDLFNKCKEMSYKESLETDSSVEFAIVELDDIEEAVEQLKK